MRKSIFSPVMAAWMILAVVGLFGAQTNEAFPEAKAQRPAGRSDVSWANLPRNFFATVYAGARADFTGNVGYEFTPATAIRITSLGRLVSGGKIQREHRVILWDVVSRQPVAQVLITPSSPVVQGYAAEILAQPVDLAESGLYRITSAEQAGGDPFLDVADVRGHNPVAAIGSGVYGVGDDYPGVNYGGAEQGYGLPTFFFERSKPRPFLRDVATGDLLQYSFRALICVPWMGFPPLSGWEVDNRGGTWDYAVKKIFAFEWFKLSDTKTTAAVSIRHQVARQTAGTVTLEFRFRMPIKMDGVRWELCDLERAGASLVTANGKLCWEAGKVLLPLEDNRDYGVKVVADITARKADVFVDGALKGKQLPFCHAVTSIDFVRIQTGVAATGDLFLSPVNLYKGYAVHETFVTSGVGKVPADWQAKSASVQEFMCGQKPDIFSLKLTRGTATKRFIPLAGKTVFECRFLLPGKSDGLRVELAGAVALNAAASYRSNLWYMAKMIADPATQTADIYLNGKLVRQGVAFQKHVRAFDMIRFAGTMWIDDVQVYPGRDYPSDYAPEPKPVAARTSSLVGVQSCHLWREGTTYGGWDYIYPYRATHKPLLGWYDDGDSEETDWEIKWKVEHGINFEMYCWYRPSLYAVGQPIKDGDADQGIIRGFFNARYSHLTKFAIMYCNDNGGFTTPDDFRRNLVPYWIEYFFKDPRYLQLDGKPVICLYNYNKLVEDLGGADGVKSAVQFLRDEAAKAGFPNLIILTLQYDGAPTVEMMQQRKAAGFDAVYAYAWFTPNVAQQQQKNIAQCDAAAKAGLAMLPTFGMGWDARPCSGSGNNGWASGANYKRMAQWVRDDFQPSLPASSLGRRMLMLDNWCEFGEGHFIMPATGTGFRYLDAIREIFTTGGAHEDTVPTEGQKRRFNVLYPKD